MGRRAVSRKDSVVSASAWENKSFALEVKDKRVKVELIFVSKTILEINIR